MQNLIDMTRSQPSPRLIKHWHNVVIGIAALAVAVVGAQAATPSKVAVAVGQQADLSTFNKMVVQAGLGPILEGTDPVTVFAPTDDAFKALPQATLDKFAKDPQVLKDWLSYHLVPGVIKSSDITGATTLTTLSGAKMAASKAGDFVTVDDGLVIKADELAGNGVLHTIDRVLTPPVKK